MSKNNRYFKKLGSMAPNALTDEYYAIATEVEETLLLTGAEPGIDYTVMDVMKLAQPLLLELMKKRKGMEYTYPADEIVR